MDQPRRAGVPIWNSIAGRFGQIVVATDAGRLPHPLLDSDPTAARVELGIRQRLQEFQLFGISEHHPGGPAGPSGERAVSLLRTGAAILAIVGIEDAFVDDPTRHVVDIPPLPE